MYGKQDTKRRDEYISAIKNGGIEYVKKRLDSYPNEDELDVINELDVDYDETKILPKGYTPMDILKFCNEHKFKCFGYNWKLEQFITNKMKISILLNMYLHLYFILMINIFI